MGQTDSFNGTLCVVRSSLFRRPSSPPPRRLSAPPFGHMRLSSPISLFCVLATNSKVWLLEYIAPVVMMSVWDIVSPQLSLLLLSPFRVRWSPVSGQKKFGGNNEPLLLRCRRRGTNGKYRGRGSFVSRRERDFLEEGKNCVYVTSKCDNQVLAALEILSCLPPSRG